MMTKKNKNNWKNLKCFKEDQQYHTVTNFSTKNTENQAPALNSDFFLKKNKSIRLLVT